MELIPFKITTDDSLLDEQNNITPYVSSLITKLTQEIPKRKENTLKKLLKYTVQFPNVPTFKNHLSYYYSLTNSLEKAKECNLWLMEEHPDYLFGKINHASFLINEDNLDEAKKTLGANLLLHELVPDRDEFHVNEVMSYFAATIKYLIAIRDVDEADKRLAMLEKIDNQHPEYLEAKRKRIISNFDFFTENLLKENLSRIEVPEIDRLTFIQTTVAPNFTYTDEIEKLYKTDVRKITEEEFAVFDHLDRDKLTNDLILALEDSIKRFHYFKETFYDEYSYLDFPSHAFIILTHLKSEEAVPMFLEVLKHNDDYIDFWFGDSLPDLIGPALYYCTENNEAAILAFIKEPNVSAHNKSVAVDYLLKILYYNKDVSRQKFINYCENIIDFIIENKDNEDILDTDFVGYFISDLIEYRVIELLPKIKKLFDLEIVGLMICGDYKEVSEEISKEIPEEISNVEIEPYATLTDVYEDYRKRWPLPSETTKNTPSNFDADLYSSFDDVHKEKPIRVSKIGRNEPCPCGSGKKYKKCCLNS